MTKKTKKITPKTKSTKLLILITLAVLAALLIAVIRNMKYSSNIDYQPSIVTFPTEPTKQAERTITKAAAKKGWVTYINENYRYEIDLPTGSRVIEEDANTPNLYTRIQNYDPGEEDYYLLKPGEYYLEISTYDSKLEVNDFGYCKSQINNPIQVTIAGAQGVKGNLKPGGGESAPISYGLCIEKDSVTFNLDANENIDTVTREIINSFRFTK